MWANVLCNAQVGFAISVFMKTFAADSSEVRTVRNLVWESYSGCSGIIFIW